jgi:hypothetical protein
MHGSQQASLAALWNVGIALSDNKQAVRRYPREILSGVIPGQGSGVVRKLEALLHCALFDNAGCRTQPDREIGSVHGRDRTKPGANAVGEICPGECAGAKTDNHSVGTANVMVAQQVFSVAS